MNQPVTVALLSLLAAVPARAAAGTHGTYEDEEATSVRAVRVGGGSTTFVTVEGNAPTFEAGFDLAPWGDHLGLRFTVGTAMRVGWGTVFVAPEVTYHTAGHGAGFSPFVAAGLQTGALSLSPAARGEQGLATQSAGMGATGPVEIENGGGTGPTQLKFAIGPQATLGAQFRFGAAGMEVGVRYALVHAYSTFYSSVGLVVTFFGPG